MRVLLFILMLNVIVVSPVYAKFFTAELLLENLNSGDCEMNNAAHGYIIGVYDSFEGSLYAQHASLSEGELIDIVKNYCQDRPNQRFFSAQMVVMRALEVHFREKEGEFHAPP